MNAFEAYQTYLALKQHFTSDYDFHKYHGKVSATKDAFKKRRDCYFFEKLAKHNDVVGFLISNIIANPKIYIRSLSYNDEAKQRYIEWLKRKESLCYGLKKEIKELNPDFNENFLVKDGQHPFLLKLYLRKKISLETFCVLCDVTGCLKYWDRELADDVVYTDIIFLVKKYLPFISYDKDKVKQLIKGCYA